MGFTVRQIQENKMIHDDVQSVALLEVTQCNTCLNDSLGEPIKTRTDLLNFFFLNIFLNFRISTINQLFLFLSSLNIIYNSIVYYSHYFLNYFFHLRKSFQCLFHPMNTQ
jgi:hypothetical protein